MLDKIPSDRATAIIEISPDHDLLPDGGVLMTGERWDLQGGLSYGLPGGGIDPGESAEAALERELWEELRLRVVGLVRLETRLVRGRLHHVFGVQAEGEISLHEWELFGVQAFAGGSRLNPLKGHVAPILLGPEGYLRTHRTQLRPHILSTRLHIPSRIIAPPQAPLHSFWTF